MAKRPPGPDMSRILSEARKSLGGLGNLTTLPLVLSFGGIVGYGLYNSIYFVPGGYAAVKFNAITGLSNFAFGEGANVAIPFLETPVLFDMRFKPIEIASASGSRDLQIINTSVRVLYKPSDKALADVYRRLGVNYADTVMPSIVNEVVKSVIAQYIAGDLLTKRQEVSTMIAKQLRHRAAHFNLEISDVSITQMTFGKEYMAAVESKQVAKQMAERAKFKVDQALQEKKGTILLAEGEAQSAALIGDAMKNNPGFIALRRIETAKSVAKAVSEGKGSYYIDAETLILSTQDKESMQALGRK